MKTLSPIIQKGTYNKKIEEALISFLYQLIFYPIIQLMKNPEIEYQNALSDEEEIIKFINEGRIQYSDGRFSGRFNSRISKILSSLGAEFNQRTKTWNIDKDLIPASVRVAADEVQRKMQILHEKIVKLINEINIDEMIQSQPVKIACEENIDDLNKQFWKSTFKTFSSVPELTPEIMQKLSDDYVNNLTLNIKNFASEEIVRLRNLIIDNSITGLRAENLEEIIQNRFNVSKTKARFLARQETSLFTSKFAEQRFREVGITEYIWKTAEDSRVREDHKILDGTRQSFNNPPIVDKKTGRRANAGEDYNCRCVALPIVE